MWPALDIGEALRIKNGLRIYFFRGKAVVDMKPENIIRDFAVLTEQVVSFRHLGFKTGTVDHVELSKKTTLPYFHITCKGVTYRISFFNVFLNKKQAEKVLKK